MKVLIIAQHENGKINSATYAALEGGRQLDVSLHILIIGEAQMQRLAEELALVHGVVNVMVIESPLIDNGVVADIVSQIVNVAQDYDCVIAGSTTYMKALMPQVAYHLKAFQVSDCTKIIDGETFERPIYAGSIIETIRVTSAKKVLLLRPTAFRERTVPVLPHDLLKEGSRATIHISEPIAVEAGRVIKKEREAPALVRPDLVNAERVVAGGRGIGSKEKFQRLEQFADKIGAAVGASRAAVDAGFISNEYQVGQTGKVVAPQVYFAIGISGATQHLAGILGSKIIVAINTDPKAPIFDVATYGIVGDWEKVLPEIEKAL